MLKVMNFDLPYFVGKDVVYVGVDRERASFEKFINEHGNIKSFRATDEHESPEYLNDLSQLDMTQTVIVKDPEIPGSLLPVPYTTVTRVFFDCTKQLGVRTIGVTGTKGKTTTSSLLAHMIGNAGIDARLCSDLGKPMLENLKGATNETVLIIELTSFQLAELQQSPDVAIITNLFRDHTDYHGNLENYWEAKRNIMRYMSVF